MLTVEESSREAEIELQPYGGKNLSSYRALCLEGSKEERSKLISGASKVDLPSDA